MSWSTDLYCQIPFSRKTYNSKSDVLQDLEEAEEGITQAKELLHDLTMMTEPDKFFIKGNFDNPYDFLLSKLQDALDLLEDCLIDKFKLELLRDNWDLCHKSDGLAIPPPDNVDWNTPFLTGDFVQTTESPVLKEQL